MRGLWWGPYDATSVSGGARGRAGCAPGARPTASARWREGALALARVGARAFGRGLPR